MARILLPLLFLVAVLGLGALLILGHRSPDTKLERQTQEQESVIEQPAVAENAELEQEHSIQRTAVRPEELAAKVNPLSPKEGGVLVSVVDQETQKALPFAKLYVLDSSLIDMTVVRRKMTTSLNVESVLMREGDAYETNRNGQVRIPEPGGWLVVAGSTDTHFDFDFRVKIVDGSYTLQLKALDILKVLVLGPDDLPVGGAPVSIRQNNDQRSMDLFGDHTDVNGIAELRIMDSMKQQLDSKETYIALAILSPKPIELPIDLNQLPGSPPVLRMPPTGSVQVSLQDEAGEASSENLILQLSAVGAIDPAVKTTGFQEWEFLSKNVMESVRDKSGKKTIPFVALNQIMRVFVVNEGQTQTAAKDFRGPEAADQIISVSLTLASDFPILTGRFLDASGTPLMEKRVVAGLLRVPSFGNEIHQPSITTDGQGRFRVPLNQRYDSSQQYTCKFTHKADKDSSEVVARITLPEVLGVGELDLGDVTLEQEPLLASGVVLDANGQPAPSVRVAIEFTPEMPVGDTNVQWHQSWPDVTQTNEGGEFEIRGIPRSDSCRLTAENYRLGNGHLEFEMGQTELVLRLEAPRKIIGQVLMDPWLDPENVQVSVNYQTGDQMGSTHSLPINEEGYFTIDSGLDGIATVSVKGSWFGIDWVIFEDLDLNLESSAAALEVIDLRGRLHEIIVTARDESGSFIPQVQARSGNSSVGGGEGSGFSILTLESELDVTFTATGFGSITIPKVSGSIDVVLPAGYPLSITLDPPNLLPEGWELTANLGLILSPANPQDTTQVLSQAGECQFDGLEYVVSEPGVYQVHFKLTRRTKNSRTSYGIGGEDPTIEVADRRGVQYFILSLSPQAVEFLSSRKPVTD